MTTSQIYPNLTAMSAQEVTTAAELQHIKSTDYRFNTIQSLQAFLEAEQAQRSAVYKKYRRIINAVDTASICCAAAGIGLGTSGALAFASIIGIPVSAGLAVGGAAMSGLGVLARTITRRLEKKAKKHDEIRVLAEASLKTVVNKVSKALTDGDITQQEFSYILEAVENYKSLKGEIRTKVATTEAVKKKMVELGRTQARASFLAKLSSAEKPGVTSTSVLV